MVSRSRPPIPKIAINGSIHESLTSDTESKLAILKQMIKDNLGPSFSKHRRNKDKIRDQMNMTGGPTTYDTEGNKTQNDTQSTVFYDVSNSYTRDDSSTDHQKDLTRSMCPLHFQEISTPPNTSVSGSIDSSGYSINSLAVGNGRAYSAENTLSVPSSRPSHVSRTSSSRISASSYSSNESGISANDIRDRYRRNSRSYSDSIRSVPTLPKPESIKAPEETKRTRLLSSKPYLPEYATKSYCTHCEKYKNTSIRYRNGPIVWLSVFLLLFCTVIFFWVPFYIKCLKDVTHYCSCCGQKLGTYHRHS